MMVPRRSSSETLGYRSESLASSALTVVCSLNNRQTSATIWLRATACPSVGRATTIRSATMRNGAGRRLNDWVADQGIENDATGGEASAVIARASQAHTGRLRRVTVGEGLMTRGFAAGPATFAVRCSSPSLRDAVERAFTDLPQPDEGVEHELAMLETEGGVVLHAPDRRVPPQAANGALATLVTSVSRLALDDDPDRLHLHCAALSMDGRGLLISAPSGTGKTTLAAALVLGGWTYVSDEAVALTLGSDDAHGFPKPLLIKPGGGRLIAELEAVSVPTDEDEAPWWIVPASEVPAPIARHLTPSLIVILHRSLDGGTDEVPVPVALHPTDAVVALMGQTMDASRFGPDAVVALAAMAAQCRCVALPVGPLADAVGVLEELIRSPHQAMNHRDLGPSAQPSVGGWRVPGEIRSVIIGDRAVVHATVGGAVLALDEAATGLWRALHHDAPAWWSPEAMRTPNAVAFLEQLQSHGLLVHVEDVPRAGAR